MTCDHVKLAWVDHGYTGEAVAQTAAHGMRLAEVTRPEAVGPKHGFVLLPKRWVVKRSFARDGPFPPAGAR
ncbi:MAG: hypothetical protein PVSMB4_12920 [Ktedonobacterales bacterium]